jgi:hypothetical protein
MDDSSSHSIEQNKRLGGIETNAFFPNCIILLNRNNVSLKLYLTALLCCLNCKACMHLNLINLQNNNITTQENETFLHFETHFFDSF